jgi:hypothetical protein
MAPHANFEILLYATLLRFSFSNKRKRKAQIESRMDKPETKATHDTEQKETTVKKIYCILGIIHD